MSPERIQEVLEWIRGQTLEQIFPEIAKILPYALASFIVAVAFVFLGGRRK